MAGHYLATVEVGRRYFAHCANPTRAARNACRRHGIPSVGHGSRQLAWSAKACAAVFAAYDRVTA